VGGTVTGRRQLEGTVEAGGKAVGSVVAGVGVEELRRHGRAHEIEGAVEDHGVGNQIGSQLRQGPPCRQAKGGGHPQAVALPRIGVADGPTRTPRGHPVEDGLSRVLGELLRISQALGDASR